MTARAASTATPHDPCGFVGPQLRAAPPRRPDVQRTSYRRAWRAKVKRTVFPRLPTPSGTPEGPQSIGNRLASTRLRPTRRAGPSSPKSSKSPGRASDVACHYAARIRSRGRVVPLKIYCGLPTDIPGGQVNFPGDDSAPGTKSSPSTDPRIVKPKVFSKGRCPDPKKLVAYRPMVCRRRLVGPRRWERLLTPSALGAKDDRGSP